MTKYPAPNYAAINPPKRILMGPGPSDVPHSVLSAIGANQLGHLDPKFLEIMDQNQQMLRYVFQTENKLTLPVSATGSAGMEACLVNLLEPGDTALICINGVFGKRMADLASRAGAKLAVIERPWGKAFHLDEIEEALKRHRPKLLGIVHAETSTGVLQNLDGLGALAHKYDALLVADMVTSLAGVPVFIDKWQVDAAYSGTQKCLSCPPGLAPVTFSNRALNVINERKSPVQSWYLDLSMVQSYWGGERAYHHTAPISMNFALHEALRLICEETLEQRWQRHAQYHQVLMAGLEAMELKPLVAADIRLPQLNAIQIPDGIDDLTVRKRLLTGFGIEIGGGLGAYKGKAWRIGLMGETCQLKNVLLLLSALELCLKEQSMKLTAGAAVGAANEMIQQLKL
ncbi:MAG: pyridoxal-phosphate-dependent aminotransferase family protein [Oligoflexus sp.]